MILPNVSTSLRTHALRRNHDSEDMAETLMKAIPPGIVATTRWHTAGSILQQSKSSAFLAQSLTSPGRNRRGLLAAFLRDTLEENANLPPTVGG